MSRPRFFVLWQGLVLAAFALAAYGPTLNLTFTGDDYVFLDETRHARFAELWSFKNIDFGWYRPWSRELHFWFLQRVAGLHEVAYRSLGVVLWIVALCLYATLVRRLSSTRVAAVATMGVASLALWGTPLLWISGSQDLWMLCFAMATTLWFVEGRVWWALLPFALALLSKETAAVLPALLCSYAVLIERRRLADALRRTAHFWTLLGIWLVFHPTLLSRLSTHQLTPETEHRPPPVVVLAKTLLSNVNLDSVPHPQEVDAGFVLRTFVSLLVLATGALVLMTMSTPEPRAPGDAGRSNRRLLGFAAVWAGLGWFPLFLPSISWHAYYGCLGALGVWLALGLWLQNSPRFAVAALLGLGLLRGAQASTLSWDWGAEWYQRRAGNMLSAIKSDLHRQHPTLPPHSRVYLGHIPNNIGLIAGNSPALRVWYEDTTLRAGFYSDYRPRAKSAPVGEDFFFRFDSLRGMVEVRVGPEDLEPALRADPDWEADHQNLAMLLLRAGDVSRAASEFEKLSLSPRHPDAAVFAAVCWESAGDPARAESLSSEAKSRMRLSDLQLQRWKEG